MNRLFKCLDKIRIDMRGAFIISSLMSILISLFLSLKDNYYIYTNSLLFINIVFVIGIANNYLNGLNRNILIALYITCDIAFYLNCKIHFSIIVSICFAFLCVFIFRKFKFNYAVIFAIASSFVITGIFIFAEDFLDYYLKYYCDFLNDKPSLYATLNNVHKLFLSNKLENLMFNTGYGKTSIINNELVVGIKNIFLNDINNRTSDVSKFLSSDYILNIFTSIGFLLNAYYKVDKKSRFSLLIVVLSTIVSGNNFMFSLFILLLNPILYLSYLLIAFITNFVVGAIDIRIGYKYYPGLIELIKYIQKPIYFMIIGIIIIALSYFVFELVLGKMNIKNDFFLDKNSKRIVTSLGGLKNIIKVEDDVVIVKNPNLVNILKLDCEIYNNRIVLLENDLIVLKELL